LTESCFFSGFPKLCSGQFWGCLTEIESIGQKVPIPTLTAFDKLSDDEIINFIGAKIKNLTTPW